MTAIILLNWNGSDLTIACLESLTKVREEMLVVIVDNASEDDSMILLSNWQMSHQSFPLLLKSETENLGFARGCNAGIQCARRYNPDFYLLLNNDTEVNPDFLSRLLLFEKNHPEYDVLTPCIRYYDDKERVWLCGGNLTFGSRTRLYQNSDVRELPQKEFIDVTFVSGCALFAKAELVDEEGNLLSNRFFFGEEDYEFSFRMRRQERRMACVLNSFVYHKVGRSREKVKERRNNDVGKNYCFYLGKLLVNRLYLSCVKYILLYVLLILKAFLSFLKSTWNIRHSLYLTIRLAKDALQKEGITRKDFQQMLSV